MVLHVTYCGTPCHVAIPLCRVSDCFLLLFIVSTLVSRISAVESAAAGIAAFLGCFLL